MTFDTGIELQFNVPWPAAGFAAAAAAGLAGVGVVVVLRNEGGFLLLTPRDVPDDPREATSGVVASSSDVAAGLSLPDDWPGL